MANATPSPPRETKRGGDYNELLGEEAFAMGMIKNLFLRAVRDNEPLTNIFLDEGINKPMQKAMLKATEKKSNKKGCGCVVIIVIGFLFVLCSL